MSVRKRVSGRLAACSREHTNEYGLALLLCALILAIFSCIELRHPYFFFQDDNRGQNLPYYIHNLRALLAGEIPLFNFHQSLGTPIFACIQSAAFYPVNYLALGLSKLFWGHYFAAMEIIALIHLLIAGLGFYYFMLYFGLKKVSCFFGAIAWPFCGFVMTAGNSWIQVLGYAALLPWILLFSVSLIQRFCWESFMALAVLRLFDLYLGYPPFFAYTVFFDLLTAFLMYPAIRHHNASALPGCRGEAVAVPNRSFIRYAAMQCGNYLLVSVLALPLLLPAFHQIAESADRKSIISWNEYISFSSDLRHWLNGLVAPFSPMADNLWYDQHFISHIGYLPLLFAVLAVLWWWGMGKRGVVLVFLLLVLVSFFWASDILITEFLYHVPIYNRLRWPFKVGFFTSFYLIAIASFGFNLFIGKLGLLDKGRGRLLKWTVPVLLLAHCANFLLLYTLLPLHRFSVHHDPVPFDEPLKEKLADGRIASVGLATVMDGQKRIYGYSAPQLGFNYPTMFGLYGFGGYELLLAEKNFKATFGLRERSVAVMPNEPLDMKTVPLDYLRQWGVKWYIVDSAVHLSNTGNLELAYSDRFRNILHDPYAKDFAYWQDTPAMRGLSWRFSTNSMIIDTNRDTAGTLIANLLYHRFFKAKVDGTAVDMLETPEGQIQLSVPAGRHVVDISYSDPYFTAGAVISGSVAALAGISFVVLRLRRKSCCDVVQKAAGGQL